MFIALALGLLLILIFRYFRGSTSVHVDFFIFGCLYYLALPGVVYSLNLLEGRPGIDTWRETAHVFFEQYTESFVFFVVLWLFSFLSGTVSAKIFMALAPKKKVIIGFGSDRILISSPPKLIVSFVSVMLIPVFVFYMVVGRNSLMVGYAAEYDSVILGGLGTVSLILYGLYLSVFHKRARFLKLFILGFLFLVCAVLLLSGTRMYVLIPIAGFVALSLIKFSKFYQRLKIAIIVVTLTCAFSLVGVLRTSELSLGDFLYIFLAEPVFTSYSLVTFWADNNLKLVEYPLSFLTSFFNLVPSMVWPDKANSIVSLENMGYYLEAPLGAASIIGSLVGNFGLVGALMFLFALGFLLEVLFSCRLRSNAYMISYVSFVSFLPFSFFRDPLSVFVKISMLISFCLPLFLHAVQRLRRVG